MPKLELKKFPIEFKNQSHRITFKVTTFLQNLYIVAIIVTFYQFLNPSLLPENNVRKKSLLFSFLIFKCFRVKCLGMRLNPHLFLKNQSENNWKNRVCFGCPGCHDSNCIKISYNQEQEKIGRATLPTKRLLSKLRTKRLFNSETFLLEEKQYFGIS